LGTAESKTAGATAPVDLAARTQQFRYHPVLGCEYNPGARMTAPRPDGKTFDFVVNSAGIRSNREYSYEKPLVSLAS
jgi:hypothetical protein